MIIRGVLETCLYCSNLESAEEFYSSVLGLELISRDEDRHLFYSCGDGMLLIFNPAHTSTEQSYVNDSPIPLHGVTGAGHIAFAIEDSDLPSWRETLKQNNVVIESEVTWPSGHISIYFRDPCGNSLELVNPGLWE